MEVAGQAVDRASTGAIGETTMRFFEPSRRARQRA
jgi:hypothetical protein